MTSVRFSTLDDWELVFRLGAALEGLMLAVAQAEDKSGVMEPQADHRAPELRAQYLAAVAEAGLALVEFQHWSNQVPELVPEPGRALPC